MLKTKFPECVDLDSKFPGCCSANSNGENKSLVSDKPASIFIEESIHKYGRELCIVNLGPMTNMALAFHLSLAKNSFGDVSSIRINGGCYTGVGNAIGHTGEGNFYFDPEAAHVVIQVIMLEYRITRIFMSILLRELCKLI